MEAVPSHPSQPHNHETTEGDLENSIAQPLDRGLFRPLSIRKNVLDEHASFRIRRIDQQDDRLAYGRCDLAQVDQTNT